MPLSRGEWGMEQRLPVWGFELPIDLLLVDLRFGHATVRWGGLPPVEAVAALLVIELFDFAIMNMLIDDGGPLAA
ncbi:hypothetical protein ACLOJK_004853 [Asimina triloba]